MLVPRHNMELNAALEVLDERFAAAKDGPNKFRIAWESLTDEELKFVSGEVYRCRIDQRYYLENYHIIKDEHGNAQALYPFWDHQEIIFEAMQASWEENGYYKLIILKPRQCGGTVWSAGLMFHGTIFIERMFTIMMTHEEDASAELYRRVWDAYNSLPWWMRPEKASKQQERHIVFQRADEKERLVDPGLGSTLVISNAQKAAGIAIGRTIRAGHFSEVSRYPDSDIWTADIEPSMNARDTRAIMESTAYGRTGLFWNMWNAAESGESDWTPVFIPVYKVRKYFMPIKKGEVFTLTPDEEILRAKVKDEDGFVIPKGFFKWRRRKIQAAINAKGSDESHYESYPVTPGEAFISSGFCAFPRKKLNYQEVTNCINPLAIGEIEFTTLESEQRLRLHKPAPEELLKKPKDENRFWVWEEPDENEAVEYYLGADISDGSGGDFTDISVYRIGYGNEPHVQVCEWHGLINASHAARVIAAIGMWYHGCEVAVEYARAGVTTGDELRWVIDYPNIYRWKHMDKVSGVATQHIHWLTTSRTRDDAINRMGEALLDNTIIIRNRHTIGEMRDFGRFEGEMKAAGIDNNDDAVMANLIAICALHQSGKRQEWAENQLGSRGEHHANMLPKSPTVIGIYNRFGQMVQQCATKAEADRLIASVNAKHGPDVYGLRAVEITVMKANTVWSPIWDSSGAENELAKLHGMKDRDIGIQHDTVTGYKNMMNERDLQRMAAESYGDDD